MASTALTGLERGKNDCLCLVNGRIDVQYAYTGIWPLVLPAGMTNGPAGSAPIDSAADRSITAGSGVID